MAYHHTCVMVCHTFILDLQQFSVVRTIIIKPNPQPLPYEGRGENQNLSRRRREVCVVYSLHIDRI